MPGHAGCKEAFPQAFHDIVSLDLTEIVGLDDLHSPAGPIQAAQALLARAYGARASYFLVNGASSGIHSLFLGLDAGAKVLVPRNAHRAFFAGMVLSGAHPVYIPCQVDHMGFALAVEPQQIAQLLSANNDVAAAFLVSPSYYGTTCHVSRITELLKNLDIPLLVDEAHGGHFYFHPQYPGTALGGGADAAINGLHKTLPVLTQGACLHMGQTGLAAERFVKACSLLTTTSPSYLIMASIDLARDWMERHGRQALDRALNLSHYYRQKINSIKGINTLFQELMITGVEAVDPLKVMISVQDLAIDGFTISRLLREEWHIQVEWESRHAILAMMSVFHHQKDWERLFQALRQIAKQAGYRRFAAESPPAMPHPRVLMSPREAFFASKRGVPFKDSINHIAGEMVVPYPPGIPCLLPGEMITPEVYSYLQEMIRSGVRLQGPNSPNLDQISIIDEQEFL